MYYGEVSITLTGSGEIRNENSNKKQRSLEKNSEVDFIKTYKLQSN